MQPFLAHLPFARKAHGTLTQRSRNAHAHPFDEQIEVLIKLPVLAHPERMEDLSG